MSLQSSLPRITWVYLSLKSQKFPLNKTYSQLLGGEWIFLKLRLGNLSFFPIPWLWDCPSWSVLKAPCKAHYVLISGLINICQTYLLFLSHLLFAGFNPINCCVPVIWHVNCYRWANLYYYLLHMNNILWCLNAKKGVMDAVVQDPGPSFYIEVLIPLAAQGWLLMIYSAFLSKNHRGLPQRGTPATFNCCSVVPFGNNSERPS